MKRYILYIMLSCLLCFTSIAQSNTFLHITNAYFTDTAGGSITNLIQGEWVNYKITVQNVANGTVFVFADTLALGCQIINPNNNYTLYRYPNPYQIDSIQPQDTAVFIFRDSVTFSRYGGGGGGGTVVIWPVTNSSIFSVQDSFLLPFVYVSVESVYPGAASLWKVYPNPTQKELFIENIESKNKIEYVRIFNTEGVLLKEKTADCTAIDIADLAEGMYFILIRDKSGKQGVYKIQVVR